MVIRAFCFGLVGIGGLFKGSDFFNRFMIQSDVMTVEVIGRNDMGGVMILYRN